MEYSKQWQTLDGEEKNIAITYRDVFESKVCLYVIISYFIIIIFLVLVFKFFLGCECSRWLLLRNI